MLSHRTRTGDWRFGTETHPADEKRHTHRIKLQIVQLVRRQPLRNVRLLGKAETHDGAVESGADIVDIELLVRGRFKRVDDFGAKHNILIMQ